MVGRATAKRAKDLPHGAISEDISTPLEILAHSPPQTQPGDKQQAAALSGIASAVYADLNAELDDIEMLQQLPVPFARVEMCLHLLRQSSYMETACAASGICVESLRDWMQAGALDNKARRRTPFGALVRACKRASALAEAALIIAILKHTPSQWTAAAWILERKYPERFGKREQLQVKQDLQVHIKLPAALPAPVFASPALPDAAEDADFIDV